MTVMNNKETRIIIDTRQQDIEKVQHEKEVRIAYEGLNQYDLKNLSYEEKRMYERLPQGFRDNQICLNKWLSMTERQKMEYELQNYKKRGDKW